MARYPKGETGKGSGYGAGMLGDYEAPAHKATTIRGSFMKAEGAGVQYGLSSYEHCDTEEATQPPQNYGRNPLTGNATERFTMNPVKTKGEHWGHSFEIC